MRIKLLLLLLPFVFISTKSEAQDLLTSKRKSPYTYIYKVSPQDKFKISNLKNPVDSFPSEGFFERPLPHGYYVLQYIEDEFIKYSYIYVPSFSVYCLNNSTYLVVKLVDSRGKVIDDADVRIKRKKLMFDQKLQAYILKDKKIPDRLLTINYNGEIADYTISGYGFAYRLTPKQKVLTIIKRQNKYFTDWYWQRIFYYYSNYFKYLPDRISDRFTRDLNSVIITNKPVYHTGDTLYFKALIVNKKGRPVRFKTTLFINKKRIKTIKPRDNAGVYTGWVVLADSLIRKDRKDYSLRLKHGKHIFSKDFQCYDYELNEARLQLRVDKKIQYKGEPLNIFVKATDLNGLNLPNANVRVTVTPKQSSLVFGNYLFMPITLWEKQIPLNKFGETKITIPADVFPKANFGYWVTVNFLYRGKKITKTKTIKYFWEKYKLTAQLQGDSIEFKYLHNGKIQPLDGTLYYITEQNKYLFSIENFSGKFFSKEKVYLPHKIKADQNVLFYYFVSDSLNSILTVKPPEVKIKGFRTKDSVFIRVDNPSKIYFHYAIYRRNKNIAEGYTDSLTFGTRNRRRKIYYVYVSYYWAGRVYKTSKKIDVRNKYDINVEVESPKTVYPGQKTDITLTVTDVKGRPVRNADIMAYSVKSAFRPSAPYIFYKPYIVKEKTTNKNFNIRRKKLPYDGHKLIYSRKFFKLYGLDTIEFYKFLNPGFIYRYETPAQDSSTVFAVYVTENGHTLNTKYIELNNKPVYYYFTGNEPYMFDVEPGVKYTLKIVTEKYLVILRDVTFNKGMKTIMSVNVKAKQNKHFQVFKIDHEFSEYYKNKVIRKHTIGVEDPDAPFAYIKQGNRYFFFGKKGNIGPLEQDNKAEIYVPNRLSYEFSVEPGWKYTFDKPYPKLKKADINEPAPKRRAICFDEHPWRKKDFDSLYREKLYEKRKKLLLKTDLKESFCEVNVQFPDLQSDVVNFVLFNEKSFSIFPPKEFLDLELIPGQKYNLLILYKNGFYQLFKNLQGQKGGITYYKLADDKMYYDKYSKQIDSLLLYGKNGLIYDTVHYLALKISNKATGEGFALNYTQENIMSEKPEYTIFGKISGIVYGAREPALVRVKGTNVETITDENGKFVLRDVGGQVTLVITSVGTKTQEIEASSGDFLEIYLYIPLGYSLEEVVVSGSPGRRKRTRPDKYTLNGPKIVQHTNKTKTPETSIQGFPVITKDNYSSLGLTAQQIKKIIFYTPSEVYEKYRITTNSGISEVLLSSGDKLFVYGPVSLPATVADTTLMHSSLRHNFRDYAFWQPTLKTDRHGQVSFQVTFPDDITQWTNFFVAYKHGKNGKVVSTTTKSYKPVMAQLDLPRFLIEHDKSFFFGTTTTYMNDTISFSTEFYIGDSLAQQHKHKTDFSVTDTLYYQDKGSDDTVSFTYKMVKDDGYFDGEQRKIPILPKGVELAKGVFYQLDKDTTITIPKNNIEGITDIYAASSHLDQIFYEAKWVANYHYYCNEQLASELLALLTMKKIAEFKLLKHKYDRNINVIIRKLRRRMNEQGLWGWWDKSYTVDWISMHVLTALREAEQQGFNTGLTVNNQKMARDMVDGFDRTKDIDRKINIINYLQLIGYEYFDPKEFAYSILNDTVKLSTWQKFSIYKILSSLGEEVPIDEIMSYKKETLFGNYYFEYNEGKSWDVDKNTLTFTLLAYDILRNAHAGEDTLRKIRNYFFENYSKTQWYNTYLKSSVFYAILPDLMKESETEIYPSLTFSGGYVNSVNSYPFSTTIKVQDSLKIRKTGSYPVYLTVYNRQWVTAPKSNNEYFTISTEIGGQNGPDIVLKQDSLYRLVTKVEVKKPVKYVMLSIPIPAGCVYTAQPGGKYHRIYQKDRVLIFASSLEPGTYRFSVPLTAHYKGTYTLNPAKIELMYFPTFYGNNQLKTVIIK